MKWKSYNLSAFWVCSKYNYKFNHSLSKSLLSTNMSFYSPGTYILTEDQKRDEREKNNMQRNKITW